MVREAWDRTRERASALAAAIVLVQTPPSFDCTDEHEANLRELLGSLARDEFEIAWEPRGDWPDHPDRVGSVCEDIDLIHVVDLLREDSLAGHSVVYTRLHGCNEDPYDYDYDYDYSERELDDLAGTLRELAASHERVFCLFNNYEVSERTGAPGATDGVIRRPPSVCFVHRGPPSVIANCSR